MSDLLLLTVPCVLAVRAAQNNGASDSRVSELPVSAPAGCKLDESGALEVSDKLANLARHVARMAHPGIPHPGSLYPGSTEARNLPRGTPGDRRVSNDALVR